MHQASLDSWTSIFLIAAFQGIILAFVIYRQKEIDHPGKNLLASLCFLFSLMLMYYVSFWTGYNKYLTHMDGLFLTLPFLFGPLFYGYFQKLDKEKNINFRFHFLPFYLHIGWFVSVRLLNIGNVDIDLMSSIFLWIFNFQALHLFVYALMTLYGSIKSNTDSASWVKLSSWSFLLFALANGSYYLMTNFGEYNLTMDYLISISMSVFIYGLSYFGLVFTKIESKRNSEPLLTPASMKLYAETLVELMEKEKIYRDGDLKLNSLADNLGIGRHALSQLINSYFKKNFADYINSYRIKEAEKLLGSDEHKDLNVVEIAFRVGFNTKASFYNAFRKKNQISPLEYKNLINNKAPSIP